MPVCANIPLFMFNFKEFTFPKAESWSPVKKPTANRIPLSPKCSDSKSFP